MPVEFSIDDVTLQMTDGLPANYSGHILDGAKAAYHTDYFGTIVIQEFDTMLACFRVLHFHFKTPVKIKCRYRNNRIVFFSRTAVDHPAVEFFKGAGVQTYGVNQFNCLFGENWQSLIKGEAAGDLVFFDMAWDETLFRPKLRKEMRLEMNATCPRVPGRIVAGRLFMSSQMNTMLDDLKGFKYDTADSEILFFLKMDNYLGLLISRLYNYDWKIIGIKWEHWRSVDLALTYIMANLDKDFTIPELSRVALTNPTNLKRYFSFVTGFTIDDYRTYMRLKSTLTLLAFTTKQVKDIFSVAHYTSSSAFCAGFKSFLLCSPTETRSDEWNIEDL